MQRGRGGSCKKTRSCPVWTREKRKEQGPNTGGKWGCRRGQEGRTGKTVKELGEVVQGRGLTFVTFFPPWHYPDIMKAFVQEVWVDASFTNHQQK